MKNNFYSLKRIKILPNKSMRIYYWSVFLCANLILVACGNQSAPSNHSPETRKRQIHQEQGILMLEEQHKVPREFGYIIGTFFSIYLNLEEALVKGDTSTANNTAKELKFLLELIPDPKTSAKVVQTWTNHKEGYQKNLTAFLRVPGLQEKRTYFSYITEILYCTFKSFNLEVGDIHLAYCPMALDNKGAYWLTDNHKIRNPYFDNKMLNCGSIVELIP